MRHADALDIHKGAHVGAADPGAVGAQKLWVDTASGPPYQLRVRNDANTAWLSVGGVGGAVQGAAHAPLVPPDLTDFAWVNQGTATADQDDQGIDMQQAALAGNNARLLTQAVPATPWTLTVALIPYGMINNYTAQGVAFRESSSGRLATLGLTYASGSASQVPILLAGKYTSPSAYSANYLAGQSFLLPSPIWFRLRDDGANRISSVSPDGYHWSVFHSVGRLDFLTGGANQVGMFVESNGGTPVRCSFVSWELEAA